MRFEFSSHIAFQVRDCNAAVAFYEHVMGMELLRQTASEAAL